eukprot:CAMPEP_0201281826 /NCGR_PEP_ID=MMETSP1317-20130820/4155_1 /ASSEMBLY_ACC=CAM_ASM_000770 /TAXON_ID=187299 /ORGANISM="Undescribed Undescribed, Strain Undescribed" /LENGTH=89 /DNA_ID=CAMNT_0047592833 /DNA_START=178 /DNA_END=447 /DNA_ORIENTATION=+
MYDSYVDPKNKMFEHTGTMEKLVDATLTDALRCMFYSISALTDGELGKISLLPQLEPPYFTCDQAYLHTGHWRLQYTWDEFEKLIAAVI